jgi:hypothetical protein
LGDRSVLDAGAVKRNIESNNEKETIYVRQR